MTKSSADAAFSRALVDQLPHLRAYAMRLTKCRPDADDLAQDAMLLALRFQARFDGENIGAWLSTICRNRFLDLRRREQIRDSVPLTDETGPPAQETQSGAVRLRELARLLRALPARHADFIIAHAGGLSYAAIAEREGVALGTVRSRLFRARQGLRDAMNPPDTTPLQREIAMRRRAELIMEGAQ